MLPPTLAGRDSSSTCICEARLCHGDTTWSLVHMVLVQNIVKLWLGGLMNS